MTLNRTDDPDVITTLHEHSSQEHKDLERPDPEGAVGKMIATITVSNPARLNCLSTSQIERLRSAFDRLSQRDDVRAVVLTGAGSRAFIGGADLSELGRLDETSAREFITNLHLACRAIQDCPVPVIARINGYCLGAGL